MTQFPSFTPFVLNVIKELGTQRSIHGFSDALVSKVTDILRFPKAYRFINVPQIAIGHFAKDYLYYVHALQVNRLISYHTESRIYALLGEVRQLALPGAKAFSLRTLILQAKEFVLVRYGATTYPSVREGVSYECPEGYKYFVLVYPDFIQDEIIVQLVPQDHKQLLGVVSTTIAVLPILYAVSVM